MRSILAIFVVCAAGLAGSAHAFIDFGGAQFFSGLLGMARGQTAHLHVVNATQASCQYEMEIVSDSGKTLQAKLVEVGSGQTATLSFKFTQRQAPRQLIHAVVNTVVESCTAGLLGTLEIVDDNTDHTSNFVQLYGVQIKRQSV